MVVVVVEVDVVVEVGDVVVVEVEVVVVDPSEPGRIATPASATPFTLVNSPPMTSASALTLMVRTPQKPVIGRR